MICQITDVAVLPDGSLCANAQFSFVRAAQAVEAQDGKVLIPRVIAVNSAGDGSINFPMLPGTYFGCELTTNSRFEFLVPAAATAYFRDCITATEVASWPDAVVEALAARDAAAASATAANVSSVAAAGSASAANVSAVAASGSASAAAGSAVSAQAARDAAMSANGIFASTAAGLAVVAVGGYFYVPGTTTLDLYKVNAGPVAALVNRFPTSAVVNAVLDSGGYLDAGRVYSWIDASSNLLGSIGPDATWDIILKALRSTDMLIYQYDMIGSGSPFYFTDGANKILYQAPSSSTASSDEVIAARGSRVSLTARLDQSLDAYGIQKTLTNGNFYLRETRQRLMTRKLGETRQLAIAAIGDSYSQYAARWTGAFGTYLKGKYGDAGAGWVGFARFTPGVSGTANGSYDPVTYPLVRVGTWTETYNTSPNSPDRSHVTSTTAGDSQTVSGPATPVLSGAKLYWIGTADGVVQYRWNGSGAYTTLNVQGTVGALNIASLAGVPSSGAWSVEVQVVSGTVSLCGLRFTSAADGVIFDKLAGSGAQLAQWLTSTNWGTGLADLAPNLVIIMEGTNSQGSSVAPSTWATNMTTFIGIIRAARPQVDILIAMPPENQRTTNFYPMSQYTAYGRQVAAANQCGFIDLQMVFGDASADYAFANANRPWYASDLVHPDPATGGRAMVGGILSIVDPY